MAGGGGNQNAYYNNQLYYWLMSISIDIYASFSVYDVRTICNAQHQKAEN